MEKWFGRKEEKGPQFAGLEQLLEAALRGNVTISDSALSNLLLRYEEIRSHTDSAGRNDEIELDKLRSEIESTARMLKLIP